MKKFFNMIEVTLALAIIGIGAAGIMVLFPVGLKSSQDAIADNYAADAAETFINYFRAASEQNWAVIGSLPTQIPDSSGVADNISLSTPAANWNIPIPRRLFQHKTVPGLYRIYQGTQGSDFYDFTAAVRIWKTPLTASVYNGTTAGWENYDYNTDNCTNSAGIHIEISWPVEKQYSNTTATNRREKRDFYMEVCKPK